MVVCTLSIRLGEVPGDIGVARRREYQKKATSELLRNRSGLPATSEVTPSCALGMSRLRIVLVGMGQMPEEMAAEIIRFAAPTHCES